MFKTNLKIAWRNLVKDKQFTFLNVLGLSAGLACALLIFLWVNDELSYDKFFANDDRIYKLFEQRSNDNGDVAYSEESSGKLSDAVKLSTPEVEYAAAVAPPGWFPQICHLLRKSTPAGAYVCVCRPHGMSWKQPLNEILPEPILPSPGTYWMRSVISYHVE